jgi:hypothetical protein
MYKLVVLSCVLSVAFAGLIPTVEYHNQIKTIVEPHSTIVETPTISHVGSVIKSIPTGVSHHSSSVVHHDAKIIEPIYAHGVEKKYISTPIVKKVVEHVPVAHKTIIAEPLSYAYAPAHYSAPAHYAAPAHYSAPLAYAPAHYSAPLSYAHHW